MRASLVLTVLGDDKPGIVERVADQVSAAGANWEESRMARLAGKFAGLLRVSVDASAAADLAARLTALNTVGLTIVVEQTSEGPAIPRRALRLALVGNDRPGIIRDISRVLASQQINIEALETGVTSAPMSGELLFTATAHLSVPVSVTMDSVRSQLEALAGELMVDLDLEDVEAS
jgi:glycine cleavage system regulatory protein